MEKVQRKIESKIGSLFLVATDKALCGVFWQDQKYSEAPSDSPASRVLDTAALQIEDYLNGRRTEFDIPLDLQGTDFQKRVWAELQKIPYGETRSYKDIANALNDSKASRAVGTANGKNPICLIVPCHRVITAGGEFGGYSGGRPIKELLLSLEAKVRTTFCGVGASRL